MERKSTGMIGPLTSSTIYFMETKPGIFEKNSKFKLQTNFVANTKYKEVKAFGWKICDRINDAIESMIKAKTTQNMSKKKMALRNLIHANNTKIIIIDTDENLGAADAEKEDVISEIVRVTNYIFASLEIHCFLS